jgi:tetratricopeptide (TPR) repeat protein
MAPAPRVTAPTNQPPDALRLLSRKLLLVPEAALLTLLLCAYLALGGPLPIALLATLLILSFTTRTLALYLARAALQKGRLPEAEALIGLALILHPWSADARALQGASALAQGAPDLAERALRQALELLPDQATYLGALSCALLQQDRATEAVAFARQALALDPRTGQAHLYTAEAERATGASPHQVEERLRGGLTVARAPETVLELQCALVEHLLGEQRMAEASLALHSAEALLPRCPDAHQPELRRRLAELLLATGQTDRARDYVQDIESLEPAGSYAAA